MKPHFHNSINAVGPNAEHWSASLLPYYMKMSQLHLLIYLNELNELWKMLIFFVGAFCVPHPQGNGKNTFEKLDQLKLGANSRVMSLSGHTEAFPYFR